MNKKIEPESYHNPAKLHEEKADRFSRRTERPAKSKNPCWNCEHSEIEKPETADIEIPICQKYDDVSNCPKIEVHA